MAAMTSLHATASGVQVLGGLVGCLQFLIHSTFVLAMLMITLANDLYAVCHGTRIPTPCDKDPLTMELR